MIQHCDPNIGVGFLGRYLDDADSDLYRYWNRLSNCDELAKEWGQHYFVRHPDNLAKCYNPEFYKKLKKKTRKRKLDQIEENKLD